MNLLNLIPSIYDRFFLFIIILTRISALFATFILFRRDLINPRVLISLSVILSIYVLMFYPNQHVAHDFFSIQMFIQMLYQFFIGFIAGFILNIVLEIFSGFGQIVSMQVGLGMASLFDPRLGNITPLTHFYTFSILLIFLLLNGHIFAIKTILDSFDVIPFNQILNPEHIISNVITYSSTIFSGSILLAIPIVIATLIMNFALAVMSKFSPQFNIFSIGINMQLILGLICVYLTFELFVNRGSSILEEGLNFLKHTMAL